ncbi:MAG: hypothetical protein IPK52_19970 [Chloroflexi bacterium]|nr:hypothetical protein [Chloroflexota bacterium]
MRRLMILAVLLLIVGGAAFAQDEGDPAPNDPAASQDANACYAGGTMEGKCALDADGDGILEDFEEDWAWECGWYLIRIEAGLIGQDALPEGCSSLLAQPNTNCYQNGESSFLYVGPPNSIGNAVFYDSLDCTGEAFFSSSSPLIFADSEAEALALCGALGSVIFLEQLVGLGYNTPANYWGCTISGGTVRGSGVEVWRG